MRNLLIVFLGLLLIACSAKPEPIAFGTDGCHTCKMTLVDKRFGAELVTHKGKVYKFDDMNCMLNFYHSGYEAIEDFKHILIIDYSNPENLIDAQHALYLRSATIRTPMASGVAGFESEEALAPYRQEWKGIMMSWGEIQTQFK